MNVRSVIIQSPHVGLMWKSGEGDSSEVCSSSLDSSSKLRNPSSQEQKLTTRSICPVLCSNRGEYIGGECVCSPGWKGKECQLREYECEKIDCNGHGECLEGSCRCFPGYKGSHCQTERDVSSDIFPFCKWTVLQDIGSDHLPILVELKWKQLTQLVKKNFWNFKKANWEKYRDTVDRGLLSKPPFECRSIDDLDESWLSFKKIIFKAAGQAIPREITNGPLHFYA
ncbi:teneurin-m [Trichonephila clavipes]|nr:teneurin-m [Trichonephila clavipes]